jgi:hypothetical protein
MGSGLRSIFEPEREYTVTELGGVKWGSPRQRMGLLGMGYDSVLRLVNKLVNNPRYAEGVSGDRKKKRRSNIRIKGWSLIRYLDDKRLDTVA